MNPQKIGRYEIRRQLGVGGMGRVMLAHDPRFPRDVALKLLDKDPMRDGNLRERFEREARIIASLEHHAIVPVYDFGEHEGQLYLVMRLMRGGSLRDRLHGRPLPTPLAIAIVQRIASALQKAHTNGVIHRDLKPANILFDDEDKPYLSDFGIVKLYESSAHLTKTGGILGTPAYMSPEQGMGETVDGRSDIYSLGIVLYEMATGRVPFQGETPVSTVLKHMREPLPPPRALNAAIDPAVERVIERALAKDPDDRYPTPGHLVRDLQSVRNAQAGVRTVIEPPPVHQGQPPVASPPPEEPSVVAEDDSESQKPRRSRAALIAAGVALVFLCAAAAGAAWSLFDLGDVIFGPRVIEPGVTPETLVGAPGEAGGDELASQTGTPTATPTMALTATPTATNEPTGTATSTATATPEPLPTSLWVLGPGEQRDQIAFVSNRSGRDAIYAIDLPSETIEQLTEPRPGERHWWPDWCGADRLVFEAGDLPFEGSAQEVWVRDLAPEGQARALTSSAVPANSVGNGLPSCAADGRTLAFSSLLGGTGSTAFRLGYLSLGDAAPQFQLIGDGYALAGNASWSADGRSIVFMHYDRDLSRFQIYRVSLNNPNSPLNLTGSYAGSAKYPDWSPATGQIAFACLEDGTEDLIWHLCATPDDQPDVTRLRPALHEGPERDDVREVVIHAITPSWSPDGRSIAYASDADGDWDIYVYDLDSGATRNLTAGWSSDEMHPSWRN